MLLCYVLKEKDLNKKHIFSGDLIPLNITRPYISISPTSKHRTIAMLCLNPIQTSYKCVRYNLEMTNILHAVSSKNL
jgi:hypothetical protein